MLSNLNVFMALPVCFSAIVEAFDVGLGYFNAAGGFRGAGFRLHGGLSCPYAGNDSGLVDTYDRGVGAAPDDCFRLLPFAMITLVLSRVTEVAATGSETVTVQTAVASPAEA